MEGYYKTCSFTELTFKCPNKTRFGWYVLKYLRALLTQLTLTLGYQETLLPGLQI